MKRRKQLPELELRTELGASLRAARNRMCMTVENMALSIGASCEEIRDAERPDTPWPSHELVMHIDLVTDSQSFLITLSECRNGVSPTDRREFGTYAAGTLSAVAFNLPWESGRLAPSLESIAQRLIRLCAAQDRQDCRRTIEDAARIQAACRTALDLKREASPELLLMMGQATLIRSDATREYGDPIGAAWLARSAYSYGVGVDDMSLCAAAQNELAAIAIYHGGPTDILAATNAGLGCTDTGPTAVRLLLQNAYAYAILGDRPECLRAVDQSFKRFTELSSLSLAARPGQWTETITAGEMWHHANAAYARAGIITAAELHSEQMTRVVGDDRSYLKFTGMRNVNMAIMYALQGLDVDRSASLVASTLTHDWHTMRHASHRLRLAEWTSAIDPYHDNRDVSETLAMVRAWSQVDLCKRSESR